MNKKSNSHRGQAAQEDTKMETWDVWTHTGDVRTHTGKYSWRHVDRDIIGDMVGLTLGKRASILEEAPL